MNTKHKYVATYQTVKYRFGNNIESIKRFTDERGLEGTACFYRIREDGSWEQFFIKKAKEKKNETV